MKILLTLFLCSLSIQTGAQPVFTNAGEIILNQAGAGGLGPSIAVGKDGSVFVTWANTVQWLNPDLSLNGNKTGMLIDPFAATAADNGDWLCISTRDSLFDFGGYVYNYHLRKFYSLRDQKLRDSSGVLFITDSYYNYVEPGNTSSEDVSSRQAYSTSTAIWLAYNVLGQGSSTGMYSVWAPREVIVYDIVQNKITSLIKDPGGWFYPRYLPVSQMLGKYGTPYLAISPPMHDSVLVLSRKQISDVDRERHVRSIQLFSIKGLSLSPERVFDTVPAAFTDRSDRIVPGRGNDFFLFHRTVPNDSIVADRYSLGGTLKERMFLLPSVNNYPPFGIQEAETVRQSWNADYDIRCLSDGSFVLVYSQLSSGSSTDVFAGLLDEHMNWMGLPKRLNSDTTGNQYAPSMALRGDTVYVVWFSESKGKTDVIMRSFQANQITGVEHSAGPEFSALMDISPNPVRTIATIRYQAATQYQHTPTPAVLQICDMLGRVVRNIAVTSTGPGIQTASLSVDGLADGIYKLVLHAGNHIVSRNLVVRK